MEEGRRKDKEGQTRHGLKMQTQGIKRHTFISIEEEKSNQNKKTVWTGDIPRRK